MQPVIAKDFQKVVMGFECRPLSKLHLEAALNISIVRKSRVLRFESRADELEAQLIPLC